MGAGFFARLLFARLSNTTRLGSETGSLGSVEALSSGKILFTEFASVAVSSGNHLCNKSCTQVNSGRLKQKLSGRLVGPGRLKIKSSVVN